MPTVPGNYWPIEFVPRRYIKAWMRTVLPGSRKKVLGERNRYVTIGSGRFIHFKSARMPSVLKVGIECASIYEQSSFDPIVVVSYFKHKRIDLKNTCALIRIQIAVCIIR